MYHDVIISNVILYKELPIFILVINTLYTKKYVMNTILIKTC